MTRNARVIAGFTTLLMLGGCAAVPSAPVPRPEPAYHTQDVQAPRELLIKFQARTTPQAIAAIASEYGLQPKDQIVAIDVHVMTILNDVEAATLAARVQGSPVVVYAEPNYRLRIIQ